MLFDNSFEMKQPQSIVSCLALKHIMCANCMVICGHWNLISHLTRMAEAQRLALYIINAYATIIRYIALDINICFILAMRNRSEKLGSIEASNLLLFYVFICENDITTIYCVPSTKRFILVCLYLTQLCFYRPRLKTTCLDWFLLHSKTLQMCTRYRSCISWQSKISMFQCIDSVPF